MRLVDLPQDMVNKYAKDMIAQKYSNAVIKVSTVLSDGINVCIFSIQNWILRLRKLGQVRENHVLFS
jgi:hypothetical protein